MAIQKYKNEFVTAIGFGQDASLEPFNGHTPFKELICTLIDNEPEIDLLSLSGAIYKVILTIEQLK